MRTLLLTFLLLLPAAHARSQAAAPVELPPGTRVRIWTEGGGRATGGVQRVSPDTLVLVPAGVTGSVVVPRASITRIDVSTGTANRGRSALKWGAGSFVAGSLIFGVLCATHPRCDGGIEGVPGEGTVGVGLYFGTGLGLLGAVFGAVFPGEGWKRVSPPGRAYVTPGSEGGVVEVEPGL
ncbi:MAG TPA: hypothetical protein VHG28_16760 [Longimicrobiaceae bacterium]|nr:hypothetical protein [Longimicrobiaceae bacterium]